MKIGLVGLGYWGKNLLHTLENIGISDILLCDAEPMNILPYTKDYKTTAYYSDLVVCDKVFIATPATSHYDICKYFISNGVDIFCEKPFVLSEDECVGLYKLAEQKGVNIFVDWVYTFSSELLYIKDIILSETLGKLQNIHMSRMNFGPRIGMGHHPVDVGARQDLASHDVAITLWLLQEIPSMFYWNDYNIVEDRAMSNYCDSSMGVLSFESLKVRSVITSTWSYPKRIREGYFVFSSGVIYWNDVEKKVYVDDKEVFSSSELPLTESVKTFLYDQNFDYDDQQKLTLNVVKIVSADNKKNKSTKQRVWVDYGWPTKNSGYYVDMTMQQTSDDK